MKLWQKTALLCAAALLCVAAACSALLLAYTRSALLDAARDGAAGRQQALAASFCELAGRYLRADDSEAAVRIPDEMAGEIEAKRTLYVTNGALDYLIPGKYVDVLVVPGRERLFGFAIDAAVDSAPDRDGR